MHQCVAVARIGGMITKNLARTTDWLTASTSVWPGTMRKSNSFLHCPCHAPIQLPCAENPISTRRSINSTTTQTALKLTAQPSPKYNLPLPPRPKRHPRRRALEPRQFCPPSLAIHLQPAQDRLCGRSTQYFAQTRSGQSPLLDLAGRN